MALQRGSCRLHKLLGDMKPAEFARRMEVNESTVSRWLTEERLMSYVNTVLGARILGCHSEDFYEWIDVPKVKKASSVE